jgi:hypothetical protein
MQGVDMVDDGNFVAVFQSIHRVMKAEKILKGKGLPVLLIPAPRALSSDCGLALRYAAADRPAVESELAAAELLPVDIYLKRDGKYEAVTREPELPGGER